MHIGEGELSVPCPSANLTLAENVRAHGESRRLAQERLPVVILWPTVVEPSGLVVRCLALTEAQHSLSELIESAYFVNPAPEDYLRASDQVQHYRDHTITLADALVAVMSEQSGLPVWTFDHHFDVMNVNVWR